MEEPSCYSSHLVPNPFAEKLKAHFGNPATLAFGLRPETLRPTLSDGLPLTVVGLNTFIGRIWDGFNLRTAQPAEASFKEVGLLPAWPGSCR
jgi:hypothetical protein